MNIFLFSYLCTHRTKYIGTVVNLIRFTEIYFQIKCIVLQFTVCIVWQWQLLMFLLCFRSNISQLISVENKNIFSMSFSRVSAALVVGSNWIGSDRMGCMVSHALDAYVC